METTTIISMKMNESNNNKEETNYVLIKYLVAK